MDSIIFISRNDKTFWLRYGGEGKNEVKERLGGAAYPDTSGKGCGSPSMGKGTLATRTPSPPSLPSTVGAVLGEKVMGPAQRYGGSPLAERRQRRKMPQKDSHL